MRLAPRPKGKCPKCGSTSLLTLVIREATETKVWQECKSATCAYLMIWRRSNGIVTTPSTSVSRIV